MVLHTLVGMKTQICQLLFMTREQFFPFLQDCTNNHAEASHRRLQNELTRANPTIWKFIDGLQKAQKAGDLQHEQMVAGFPSQ